VDLLRPEWQVAGGMSVHIAARVLALSGANEVLVASTVHDALVGTGIATEARGGTQLRSVPGSWRLFVVV
jgi:class 3 adenylate cyclase